MRPFLSETKRKKNTNYKIWQTPEDNSYCLETCCVKNRRYKKHPFIRPEYESLEGPDD